MVRIFQGKFILGQMDNGIQEIIERLGTFREIMTGHSKGGILGVACHPTRLICATTGDDRTIRIWDIVHRVRTVSLRTPTQA